MVKGRSGKRKKWFNFASDLDHYLDLLDPRNVIFKDKYLKKSWMDFYEIFRKCLKWDKEQMISFWE